MKRTIIALVTAGLPFAAAAEVTLYGQIKSSVSAGQVRIKGGSGTEKSPTVTKINDNTSRIGFKGSEKIGDDLKAIWQVEQRTSVLNESNSTNWGSRDSFIGLEGGFGKIRAGHMNNLLNEMDTIDTWLYKSSALGLGAYVRTGSRTTSVRYDSPSFGGLKANLQYSPRDNQNPRDRNTHAEPSRDQYNVGLTYENSGFTANLAYNLRKNRYAETGGGERKDGHVVRLESYYDKDNLFLGLGAQYARGNETANDYLAIFTSGFNTYNGSGITADTGKQEAVKVVDAAVTAGYNFGNWRPRISYARGWPAKGVESGEKLVDKFDQIIVGGDYTFSKRTALRGQIGYLRVGGKTRLTAAERGKIEQSGASLGMVHKF